MGGYSSEYKISIKSGEVVYKTLSKEKDINLYKVIIKKNEWYHEDKDFIKYEIKKDTFQIIKNDQLISIDLVFNTIHGIPGENGEIQSYLEEIGINQTSSESYESKITFDKNICKEEIQKIGYLTPKSLIINKNDDYLRFGYSVGFKRIDDNGHMLKNNNHDKADLNGGLSLFTADDKLKVNASFGKKKVRYRYPTNSTGKTEGTPFLNTQKDRRHITTRSINLEYKVANLMTLGSTYKYWYMHKWVESGYQAWGGAETNSDTNFWEKREGFDYYARHSKDFNSVTIDTLLGYDSVTESSDYNTFGGTYYAHEDDITQYYGNINFKLETIFFLLNYSLVSKFKVKFSR